MNFEEWLKAVPGSFIREDSPPYRANQNETVPEGLLQPEPLSQLLQNIPLP